MNEKIKELAGQALDKVVPYTWTRLDYDEIQKLQEYFAELIVRECVVIVSKRKNQAIDDGWNVDEAMTMAEMDLEEHFGIE